MTATYILIYCPIFYLICIHFDAGTLLKKRMDHLIANNAKTLILPYRLAKKWLNSRNCILDGL